MKINKLVLFVGPSAVGKGSLYQILLRDSRLKLKLSCSVTTRSPRVGEVEGQHYYFVKPQEFLRLIEEEKLVEYNQHFENYYGTLFSELEKISSLGFTPFVEIETEGAKQILRFFKKRQNIDAVISFFVAPPSIYDLEDRLRRRNTEDEQGIQLRLEKAKEELKEAKTFQYLIINDNVLRASQEIRDILIRELKIS